MKFIASGTAASNGTPTCFDSTFESVVCLTLWSDMVHYPSQQLSICLPMASSPNTNKQTFSMIYN